MFRFFLLGELRAYQKTERLELPPFRTHPLLATLLLHPGLKPRYQWCGLVFPDMGETEGRRRLSDLLYLLRRTWPDLQLEVRGDSLGLERDARWLDVEAFRTAASHDDLESWLQALALYKGELLGGYCEDWLLEEREALRLHYVRLAHLAGERLYQRQCYEQALPIVEGIVQQEPYDESALRLLMQILFSLGRRGAALAAYECFLAGAAEELNIIPETATQELARSIREARVVPHKEIALPNLEDSNPDHMIRYIRLSMEQGARSSAKEILSRLRQAGSLDVSWLAPLLEFDFAFYSEDYATAERLLKDCDPQNLYVSVRLAELAQEQRNWEAARSLASEALVMAHEKMNVVCEVSSLLVLSRAQSQLGDDISALRSTEKAIHQARLEDMPLELARSLSFMGRLLILQGQFERANEYLDEVLALAEQYGLIRQKAVVFRLMGWEQVYTGYLFEAIEYYQRSLQLWRDLGLQRREARLLVEMSEIYAYLGKSDRSQRLLIQAEETLECVGDHVQSAISQYNRVYTLLYATDGNAPQAIALAQKALLVFRATAQTGWEAATLCALGYALWVNGQYEQALESLEQSYCLHEARGDFEMLSELRMLMALSHLKLGNVSSASTLSQQAVLGLAKGEHIDESIAGDIYYSHALVLETIGNEEKSHEYYRRAYQKLVDAASQLKDEAARRALFHRSPISRRLMAKVYQHQITVEPSQGSVRRMITNTRNQTVEVVWTLDAGPADQALKQAKGAIVLRRSRLERLVREAKGQGVRPTCAQLAEVLGVSERTVQRDLAALRNS